MKKLFIIAGVRPNFIKIAPLMRSLKDNKIIKLIFAGKGKKGNQPRYRDGNSAERIVKILEQL